MGTNPTKAADNIYCKCRKEAAKYNDKLNSREGAAELLGISASTLADYELGITKIIPADAILRMADLYNAPELRNHYCKYSCPLGQDVPLVDTESLDRIAVRALASLKKVQESKENLLDASTNPCVFMLDEVDTISCNRERTSSGADREIGRVTVTLMQEFDKLANDVVVIAATNRLDILDKAFVSRCSQKYEMPPFTVEESKQMVNKFLNDIEISISDIEIDQIVQKNSDQRTIMADVIRLIADRLEVEDENS